MALRGFKTFARRVQSTAIDVWGLVLALGLRLVSVVVRIEVQEIWAVRIGHLALEPEMLLCRRALNPPRRTRTIFYAKKPISNAFLLAMWRRVVPFGPAWLLHPIYTAGTRWPWLDIRARGWDQQHFDLRALDEMPPHVAFTDEELQRGRRLLADLGIGEGQPFVCLAVRDGAYLQATQPERDWAYHDYRDSRIDSYLLMAERLADAGYVVLRMGAVVAEPFASADPRIIDYANSGLRSDFADIFLFANCAICISTSTGVDSVAMLFRRPLVLVNLPGAGGCQLGGSLKRVMFKTMVDAQSGQPLALIDDRRFVAMSFHRADQFTAAGIDLVDNSPEQLAALADEVIADAARGWDLGTASPSERAFVRAIPTVGVLDDARFRLSATWLHLVDVDDNAQGGR